MRTGDEIYVASNPRGLEGSFTKGIVSSVREKDRVKPKEDIYDDILRAAGLKGTDRTLFQIDAAISPGSSGGLLINAKAQAIGIIKSSVVSGQNLNFAIPLEQLIALEKKFKHPIILAGACAYTDRKSARLKGMVKSVTTKSRYSRIENGRLIETEPLTNSISVYDIDGNEIESHFFSVDGQLISKFIKKFDESRMVDTAKIVGPNGGVEKFATTFEGRIKTKLETRLFNNVKVTDPRGDKQYFDSVGNMFAWNLKDTRQVYEYDNEGREKEIVQWRNGQIEIRTKYRYKDDSYGNWIEKYEYSNYPNAKNSQVGPNEWIEGNTEYREITYYE